MNVALICLFARTAPTATAHIIERTARSVARLARRHLEMCEVLTNEPDPDGDHAEHLAHIERKIVEAVRWLGCTARFDTDPRGITVWIVGADLSVVDA